MTSEQEARIVVCIGLGVTISIILLGLMVKVYGAPLPLPKAGQCPSGYHESGGFCTPLTSESPDAIPKGNGPCPSNWFQSGAYCVRIRR